MNRDWIFRNLANFVTFVGVLSCPILLWCVLFYRESISWIIFWSLFILLTDFVDGQMARRLNIVSKFGAALDRLRDKCFQFIMFAFIILDHRVHFIVKTIAVPMVIIEIFLFTIWFMGVWRGQNVSASWHGKCKMFLMSAGILFCLIAIAMNDSFNSATQTLLSAGLFALFAFSLYFAGMSFKNHIRQYNSQPSC